MVLLPARRMCVAHLGCVSPWCCLSSCCASQCTHVVGMYFAQHWPKCMYLHVHSTRYMCIPLDWGAKWCLVTLIYMNSAICLIETSSNKQHWSLHIVTVQQKQSQHLPASLYTIDLCIPWPNPNNFVMNSLWTTKAKALQAHSSTQWLVS